MMRHLAFALACACAPLAPAYAHVVAHPAEGTAGSYFQTEFVVPHGCGDSPTVVLRVHIPDGVLSAKPQVKPGWAVSIRTRNLDKPIKGPEGKMLDQLVDEVEWRGGPLPVDQFDTFGLMVKLPDTPGQTLYFPVEQECLEGSSQWTEIPATSGGMDMGGHAHGGTMKHPAPAIRILPAP
ncbi:MAG TPA: YcnI family protein [Stenotrophobium sp.]|nr:YcnI family protein [Stenotrophobium sp.]